MAYHFKWKSIIFFFINQNGNTKMPGISENDVLKIKRYYKM